ncbi:hypothetical protein [Ensifer aridi]|uniref:hypothetical protein n=1 Tax=Ensifer aridi TaxID=1708715 RepID=UPI00111C936C|nr:hypothetical protein [Ensifer aridi]
MWWRSKQPLEQVPWYRAPGYKGNLTEAEKRQLDAFRMQEQHPSARYIDLPNEVQSYISAVQIELYDLKQSGAASRAMLATALGAAVLYASYFGIGPTESHWPYLAGLALLIAPWFFYRSEWRRNADEFLPRDPSAPTSTDELIKREWELDFMSERDDDKSVSG